MDSVLIVAAEASSVLYAKRLIQQAQAEKLNLNFFGIGDQSMQDIGFERIGKSEQMAVVGAVEILKHYKELKKVFNELFAEAIKRKPKVIILMDYPGFNIKFAKQIHKYNIPCVYYISPQVWAWKKNRIFQIKQYCQKVLLLFPFEIDFYKQHHVDFDFVGHPILDELNEKYFQPDYNRLKRSQYGVQSNEVALGLMPGSRKSEVAMNFPTQIEVAKNILNKHKQVRLFVLVAPNFEKEDLLPYLENLSHPYHLIKNEPFEMINVMDIVLATSGTATLMVGLLKKPMVIMYKLNWLTALIAKLIVTSKYFGLVNLILDKEICPERFQEKANTVELTNLVNKFVVDIDYYKNTVSELSKLHNRLGEKGATQRVLNIIKGYLK